MIANTVDNDPADPFRPPDLAPDYVDLLGFEGGSAPHFEADFSGDALRKYLDGSEPFEGRAELFGEKIGDPAQWLSPMGPRGGIVGSEEGHQPLPYIVSTAPEFGAPRVTRKRTAKAPKIGRPRTPGPKPRKGPDKRVKTMSGPLTRLDRYDIKDAMDFGEWMGRRPNSTLNLHPGLLDQYPAGDLREWFIGGPWRAMSEEMRRRQLRAGDPQAWWNAVAVAENYVGPRRQHYHLMWWCPDLDTRDSIESMLNRRFPGDRAVDVGELHDDEDDDETGLAYRMKQSAGNAMGPARPGRAVAEICSRFDGAAVAEVLGQRYSVSRSLDIRERQASGWQQQRDDDRQVRRDHFRAKARALADA